MKWIGEYITIDISLKRKTTIKPSWKKWILALAIEEIEINTKMTYLSQINMNTIKRYMYIYTMKKKGKPLVGM